MTTTGTWRIRFAGKTVGVMWHGREVMPILQFLFGESAPVLTDSPEPLFQLSHDTRAEEFILKKGASTLTYRYTDPGKIAGVLLDLVVSELGGLCEKGPAIHAGAVISKKGVGILLPGKSGAGKSTLAAFLGINGFDYITDELVCVENPSDRLNGFFRPAHIKKPADAIFWKQHENKELPLYKTVQGCLIHPSLLSSPSAPAPSAGLIAFPRYVPETVCRITPLTPADACARLMGMAINARNMPCHGLKMVARFCRKVPAVLFVYNDLVEAVEQMARLTDGLIH